MLVYALPRIHSFTYTQGAVCVHGFALCFFDQLYSLEIFLYGHMYSNCFSMAFMVG